LFRDISEQQGFECCCRDPRCSFRCQQNHGKKESVILQLFAERHFRDRLWFKGCLKLKLNATQQDHNKSFDYFSDLLRAECKKEKIKLKFRGRYHATALTDKHLDYIAWSDCKDLKKIQSIWYRCAKRSGFINYACKPINTMMQLRGWSDYIFRRYAEANMSNRFHYLLNNDGTAIIRGSQGFFEGTSHKDLWEECKSKVSSNVVPSNKATSTRMKLSSVYEILDSELPIDEKLTLLLPHSASEAIRPQVILWLTNWNNEILVKLIFENPSIRWNKTCIFLESDETIQDDWKERLFGRYGVPYHSKWFPHPFDYDKEVHRIVKEFVLEDVMDEHDFFEELKLWCEGKC